MTEHLAEAVDALFAILASVARLALPPWLTGGGDRQTHGSSRWARPREAKLQGRVATAENLHGDGAVLGWFGHRLIQSPAEDNVLVLGVQRSGKTSTVVVPTLLGWAGAVVATSTKEELVALTSRRRQQFGPVWVFAPLDRDHRWIDRLGLRPASWNPVTAAATC